jgi:KDO2-lipid IV(A) lauroyltransferase
MATLLRLFALLPLPVAHLLGTLLGWLLYLLPNSHRRISQINIDLCFPQMSDAERNRLLRRSLIESGKTLFEAPNLWFSSRSRIRSLLRTIEGEDVITNERRQSGVVIISPHIGSWEIIGLYCSLTHPITSIYRKPRQASLDEAITNRRAQFGSKLVPIGPAGIKALLTALRNREATTMQPDQDPRDNSGLFTPFFGHPAYTPTLLARLVQKSGAKVVMSVAQRATHGGGFNLSFYTISDITADKTTEEIITAFNRETERVVRQNPELYQWSYKRFRTRPEGEAEIY